MQEQKGNHTSLQTKNQKLLATPKQ